MANKEEIKELFRVVKEARETCAGSNVKPFHIVQGKIGIAIVTAFEAGLGNIEDRLKEAYNALRGAKNYGDRLEPDNILCEVCNSLMEKYPEWI